MNLSNSLLASANPQFILPTYVGYSSNYHNNTVLRSAGYSIYMDAVAGTQAGDVVYLILYTYAATGQAVDGGYTQIKALTVTTGSTLSIWYKRLTAADRGNNVSAMAAYQPGGFICAAKFAVRGVHPTMPPFYGETWAVLSSPGTSVVLASGVSQFPNSLNLRCNASIASSKMAYTVGSYVPAPNLTNLTERLDNAHNTASVYYNLVVVTGECASKGVTGSVTGTATTGLASSGSISILIPGAPV